VIEARGTDRYRILYIEDNLSNLTLIEHILHRQPAIELIPAMQGTIGLELARQHHPDLIVLDLHLPDLSGEDVLRGLKAEAATSGIPVVVLSADAGRRRAAQLIELGAADYLTKPLDVARFLEVIAAQLGACSAEPQRIPE
jgi:DNA-binding response OmpR family regulator